VLRSNLVLGITLLLAPPAIAQSCGSIVVNPVTGLLDCAGTGGTASWTVTNLGTVTGNVTLNLSSSSTIFKATLVGNVTLSASGSTSVSFQIDFSQDATGGRSVSYASSFAGGGTLDPSANAECFQTFNFVAATGLAVPANAMTCPNGAPGLIVSGATPYFLALPSARPTAGNCATWTTTGIADSGGPCGGGTSGSTLLNHVGTQSAVTLTASTDNTIYSYSLPAIPAGACVQLTTVTQHTGTNTITYHWNFGATASPGGESSATTSIMRNRWRWCNKSGVQNAQDGYDLIPDGFAIGTTSITVVHPTENTAVPGVVVKMTANPGTNASEQITLLSAELELLR
jgi:hypothetical protein